MCSLLLFNQDKMEKIGKYRIIMLYCLSSVTCFNRTDSLFLVLV